MKLAASVLLCLALGACAARVPTSGLSTALEPGQTLHITAAGRAPVAEVHNRGPGRVVVEAVSGQSITQLGSPGTASVPAARPLAVRNISDARADIDVLVFEASTVDIRGPVAGGK